MTSVLIAKIKHNNNIDIKIKEINKEKGLFYAINIRADLSNIGNGVFHSAKINTVSHVNRVVNMKLVFSDNENLHNDMKVNVDSLFQCFREIAPDTITNIHIESFKDQIDNEHLCIILSTIKGSSLTYVYKKMTEFVNVINEKYGVLPSPKYNKDNKVSINDIAEEMISKNNESDKNTKDTTTTDTKSKSNDNINININTHTHTHVPLPEIVKESSLEPILEVKNDNKYDNKSLINNSILHVIETLEKEEKRLLLELENVRKLIKSQNSILEISQAQENTTTQSIRIPTQSTPTQSTKTNIPDKTSFAYKVMYGS